MCVDGLFSPLIREVVIQVMNWLYLEVLDPKDTITRAYFKDISEYNPTLNSV